MTRQVEEIKTSLDEQSKGKVVVVGRDKYAISSELVFYDVDGDGTSEMSGQHLLGEDSLMWASWKPISFARGKLVLMVAPEKTTSVALFWPETSKEWIRPLNKESSRTAETWGGFLAGLNMVIDQTTLRSPPLCRFSL